MNSCLSVNPALLCLAQEGWAALADLKKTMQMRYGGFDRIFSPLLSIPDGVLSRNGADGTSLELAKLWLDDAVA